jgi:WD40 repeat protein
VTAFSPDGTFLASGCIWEDKCACIYLFDLAQGTCTGSFKMPQEDYLEKIPGISTLSYSPNGELIAAASYKKAYVWNVKTKQALLKLNARDHIIFSSDGHYLAVAHKKGTISKEGAVSLWIQQS